MTLILSLCPTCLENACPRPYRYQGGRNMCTLLSQIAYNMSKLCTLLSQIAYNTTDGIKRENMKPHRGKTWNPICIERKVEMSWETYTFPNDFNFSKHCKSTKMQNKSKQNFELQNYTCFYACFANSIVDGIKGTALPRLVSANGFPWVGAWCNKEAGREGSPTPLV